MELVQSVEAKVLAVLKYSESFAFDEQPYGIKGLGFRKISVWLFVGRKDYFPEKTGL